MYREIVVEVIYAPHENSRHHVRVRPLPGQRAREDLRAECPLAIRGMENIGRIFRIRAKFKNVSTAPQLYTYYGWKHEAAKGWGH